MINTEASQPEGTAFAAVDLRAQRQEGEKGGQITLIADRSQQAPEFHPGFLPTRPAGLLLPVQLLRDRADALGPADQLGNALTRIASAERGIELLGHPLYQVRQGAVRALASRIADGAAGTTLIGKIIEVNQDVDPADLPSPFPYAAFQAIDLALWNLEYIGTEDDLNTLKKK